LITEQKYSHSSEELLIGAARNKTTARKEGRTRGLGFMEIQRIIILCFLTQW